MGELLIKSFEPRKRQLSQSLLLKDEILLLQKELDAQTSLRSSLEKAMNNSHPLSDHPTSHKSLLSQPAEDLIKEIAALENEVVYLEKYLLSMYRRNFAKRLSNLHTSPNENEVHSLESVKEEELSQPLKNYNNATTVGTESPVDSGIFRSLSSLSHRSACSFRASPPFEAVTEAFDSYHSLPLQRIKADNGSNGNTAEYYYIGASFADRVCETPNWLSEEMIKCISTVYCHLSDPPLFNRGHHEEYSFSGSQESSSGTFFAMVEIQGIFRDSERLNAVQEPLQNYRSLISRLGKIDPGKLKNEEKLAFWINVHNALVMHAFIVYGIPRGSVKRISLVLKAAYNIGGQTISIDTIQSSILGCRLPRPALWLNSLFSTKKKFKAGDVRKAYAVKQAEPRLRFALCSGCLSDPLVRVYTAKKVFQELEMAKEEYIQMNIKIYKEQRLLVPKNVECYVKEMGLSQSGLAEMLEHSMPHSSVKSSHRGKLSKKVDWIPHNFAFRFLLSNELVQ
ncbi:hypothetical protein ACP275_02G027200 [Erythranthe tilingii]